MPEILNLEYACTAAELREAEELNIRRTFGGGSAWRTYLILLPMLGVALVGLYHVIAREVPLPYRPYVFIATLAVLLLFVLWRRRVRRDSPAQVRISISEDEIRIVTADSNVSVPWSGFGQSIESRNLFLLLDRPKGISLVLPKRVFPDEKSQSWFRNQTASRVGAPESTMDQPSTLQTVLPSDTVRLRFKLGFRDYFDRTLASWRTWAIAALIMSIMVGVFLNLAIHPPPGAIYSPTQVLLMFLLPSQLVMVAFMVTLIAIYSWLGNTEYLVAQDVALSEQGIVFAGRDGTGVLEWSAYSRFKQTPWSFIIWRTQGGSWLMLPKRAFASAEDISRCASLLSRHLQLSRWFFG